MNVVESLTLIDIAKLVGITFMALMAFVSLLFTVLSILIFRNNKTEVEAAKTEVLTATSELHNSRIDLDKYIKNCMADIKEEFHWAQYDQKDEFQRDLSMQMNISLLEFESEINNPSDDRVYVLMSRLMNTATNECVSIVNAILDHKNISEDVKAHGRLLISEVERRSIMY